MDTNFNPGSMSAEQFAALVVKPAEQVRQERLAYLKKEGEARQQLEDKMDEVSVVSSTASTTAPLETSLQAVQQSTILSTTVNPLLSKRIRVTFELSGGFYTIPAIDVKLCKYGVMVMMPAGLTDATFTPAPGTELAVSWGDKHIKCFSPGTVFDLPEFNCLFIILIRADID